MIVQVTKVEDDRMYFKSAFNIKVGVPYLIKPERTGPTEFTGNLFEQITVFNRNYHLHFFTFVTTSRYVGKYNIHL